MPTIDHVALKELNMNSGLATKDNKTETNQNIHPKCTNRF